MVDMFLRAKHWQIFLWILVIPFVGGFAVLIPIILTGGEEFASDPFLFRGFILFAAILCALAIVSFYGWIWSMERGIHTLVPDELKLKPIAFKVSFNFSVTYISLILTVLFAMVILFLPEPVIDESTSEIVKRFFATFFPLMLIFHVITMFCTIYCFYHAAKTIKMAEKKRPVKFWDYAGEFFMIWFFHFGVWVLQPKLNALYDANLNTSDTDLPNA